MVFGVFKSVQNRKKHVFTGAAPRGFSGGGSVLLRLRRAARQVSFVISIRGETRQVVAAGSIGRAR